MRKRFKEACTEAHLQTNNEAEWQKHYYDRATSTVQLMPGDIILMKLDAFQGKRKVKDRWKVKYVVVHQVANDVPAYEVKDDSGNIKDVHHNRLFLVAPMRKTATPLGGGESVSYVSAACSALAELTPLECEGQISESEVEKHTDLAPLQSCSTWMGGWCSMATTFGGAKMDFMWVRIW